MCRDNAFSSLNERGSSLLQGYLEEGKCIGNEERGEGGWKRKVVKLIQRRMDCFHNFGGIIIKALMPRSVYCTNDVLMVGGYVESFMGACCCLRWGRRLDVFIG